MSSLGLKGRLGWGLGDQVLSSLTNAGLSVLVARSVDVTAFGAFGLAFFIYSFAVGTSRALCSQPLAIRYSAAEAAAGRGAAARSTGTALVFGVLVGAVLALVGVGITTLDLGTPIGAMLIALGVTMPGLLVQDAWRYVFFTWRRPRAAAANDAVWGTLQFGLIGGLVAAGVRDVAWFLAAWGLSATLAAVLGCWQARLRPRPGAAVAWLREHRDVVPFLTGEYVTYMGTFNVAVLVIGALGHIVAVAAMRGAQVLLGPLRTLFYAAQSAGLPELSRRASVRPGGVPRDAAFVAAALGGTAAVATGVLMALPRAAGVALLGDTWDIAREVLPWTGLMMVANGIAAAAILGLQALALARVTLRGSVIQAPFTLVLSIAGVVLWGAVGAAAGFAVANLVGMAYLWWRLVAAGRHASRDGGLTGSRTDAGTPQPSPR